MKVRSVVSASVVVTWMTSFGMPWAAAQSLTVQQPVVDVFNVSTVVSVPDRGSALLGGVSRAADARGRYGFLPGGSSLGSERSHTTASAHVYIHDLSGMDAELLATPVDGSRNSSVNSNRLASQAYRSLGRRVLANGGRPAAMEPARPPQPAPTSATDRFAESLAAASVQRQRAATAATPRSRATERFGQADSAH